ncbi:tetratricopeptide repeat protein [Halosquirtibacter xylanolyticus]|uniref:tetratricopeptide repeat protein n=1 Tax=Halosquirtibacter xylanolyticus TaxID=3374599 RepID=UPI003748620A|nr:tetratricopeptide repeat protein [Prolixibacteraceae bacterium]
MKKTICLVFGFLLTVYVSHGQILHGKVAEKFEKALEMYNNGNYSGACIAFEEISESSPNRRNFETESAYYYASSSLHLNQERGYTLMQNFISRYADSRLATQGSFELASKYFAQKKYDDALVYFNNVSEEKLEEASMDEFHYKRGYCLLNQSEFESAKNEFFSVVSAEESSEVSMYNHAAHSYLAYIFYEEGKYGSAQSHLKLIENDPEFDDFVKTYKCQIMLKKGAYEEALKMAQPLYEKAEGSFKGDMARLIGEAYFMQKDYKKALTYFETYASDASSRNDQADYYYAYCLFYDEQYQDAKDIFERTSKNNSLLGQNSLYHLGACADKLGDRTMALDCLLKASKMDFDPKISEDAFFLSTKISYLENWSATNDPLNMFNDYIKKYPYSESNREAYRYLALTFSNTPNNQRAIEIIDSLSFVDKEMRIAYEINCNKLGLKYYMQGEYQKSIELFDQSKKYGSLSEREEATAFYWLGECYYSLGNYDQALDNYLKYKSSPGAYLSKQGNKVNYSIGYCYYMKKDYSVAQRYFERFIYGYKDQTKAILADGYNRNGDCFYVLNKLPSALNSYTKAFELRLSNPDYSLYQSAHIYNNMNDVSAEEKTWNKLLKYFPNSTYATYSHLQLGKSMRNRDAMEQSKGQFKKVVESNDSKYVPEALLGLSGIYIREKNYNPAIETLKTLIEQYPSSDKRKRALSKLKSVYIETNQPDAYVAYVKTNHIPVNKDDVDPDALRFQAIETHYNDKIPLRETVEFSSYKKNKNLDAYEQKKDAYVLLKKGAKGDEILPYNHTTAFELSLKKYINDFPKGAHRREVYHYLVTLYSYLGNKEKSYMYNNLIIRLGRGAYYAQALKEAAAFLMNEGRFEEAMVQYQRMRWIEGDKDANVTGYIGYVRASFAAKKWSKVIEAGDKLSHYGSLSTSLRNEVRYLQGLSYLKIQENAKALAVLENVKFISYSDKYSVNAVYRRGVLLYQAGRYDDCVNLLLKEYGPKVGPNANVLARYYIVATQAMLAKGDKLMAKVTVQSFLNQGLQIEAPLKAQLEKILAQATQTAETTPKPKDNSKKKSPKKTQAVHF